MSETTQKPDLIAQRYAKLEQIKQLGHPAYPHSYNFSHTLEQIDAYQNCTKEQLEAQRIEVRLCGRLVAMRGQGKAGFCNISSGSHRLQIYTRLDEVGEPNFALYQLLDIGDFMGVEGYLFRTKTNELSVHARKIDFLAKSFLPLPEKWHGLADVEIRYRQRYLDLIANLESRQVFVTRSKIIKEIRNFLDARGYVEVETPMMQAVAGGATARPFKTHHNALGIDLYLRVAPELYLKRLIVGQLERVYEINRNFRNEGISTHHNPEFTMVEFYQSYSDYRDLMDLTEELIKQLAQNVLGRIEFEFEGQTISLAKWRRYSLKEAVLNFWPPDCLPAPEMSELENGERLRALARRWNDYASLKSLETFPVNPEIPVGVLLGMLFEAVAERQLVQPTTIYDYPIELSPLSKTKASDPSLVERFELYMGGMEIANAYSELNDPEEQKRRFESQMAEREKGDEEAHPMDDDYVRALCYGMPPTAGEGIGIDRLTMLFTNSRSIRDVILFPHMRPEKRDS
ncbi:MAG: lysine--tRNA ligase [Acidobacteria bacterium]|nr:lysine--tRNA ligase [Acidobacteriota bacterium]MCI0718032.1 lysine--tRNA ligase [Acidobacteriota bacterium]